MITCAGTTPYAWGCFFFDIWLPEAFPDVPPMVEILTTGGGTTMMSPNLYADGKVCMAMLNNTNSGFKDEVRTRRQNIRSDSSLRSSHPPSCCQIFPRFLTA